MREALLALALMHLDAAYPALRHLEHHWPAVLRLTGGHKRRQLRIREAVLLQHAYQTDDTGGTETHVDHPWVTGSWSGKHGGQAKKKRGTDEPAGLPIPRKQEV